MDEGGRLFEFECEGEGWVGWRLLTSSVYAVSDAASFNKIQQHYFLAINYVYFTKYLFYKILITLHATIIILNYFSVTFVFSVSIKSNFFWHLNSREK